MSPRRTRDPSTDHGPVGVFEATAGFPRNHLRACLLLIGEEAAHGYDLSLRLAALGFDAVDSGALYRALRRMEKEGCIESSWAHSRSGPPRRTYLLTEQGARWLRSWVVAMEASHRWTSMFLRRYRRSEPSLHLAGDDALVPITA